MNDEHDNAQTDKEMLGKILCHEPSGRICLVAHGDGEGQCHVCDWCGEYIRPQHMDLACPKRTDPTPFDPITMSRSQLDEIRETLSATDAYWKRLMTRMIQEYNAKCMVIEKLMGGKSQ